MTANMNDRSRPDAPRDGVSRREFLAQAGAAGSLALAAGSASAQTEIAAAAAPASGPRKIGPNDKINIAWVGVGGRGRSTLEQNLKVRTLNENFNLVSVCDVYQRRVTRAMDLAKKHGMEPKGCSNYEDVINDPSIDAIVISTPDHWHAPIAIDAMKKGKDIYCEKPMTHTIPEAREMAETAEKLGRIVQVGSQTTSADQWWQAKKAIQDGMIGKLLMSQGSYHRNSTKGEWNYGIDEGAGPDKTGEDHLDWEMWQKPAVNKFDWYPPRYFRFRKYWDYSGGIATDLFFHVMAPMNLCWPKPEFPWRVSGMGGIYAFDDGREVPDTFMMVADYPSGHTVVLSSSMANSKHIPGLIRGKEGTITMVPHGMFEAPTAQITVAAEKEYKTKFEEKWGKAEVSIETRTKAEALTLHFQNFYDCIRSREQPVLNASTAYRVQVAITLSAESYQRGQVLFFDEETQTVTDRRPASTMKLARPGCINGENVEEPGYGKAVLNPRKA